MRDEVHRSPPRVPDDFEDPLAAMRGCLLGLAASAGLWVLGGLVVFGLYELGLLATAALVLAAIGGVGLVAGTLLAARRLGGSNGQRRSASGPGQPRTKRGHVSATRAVRHPDDT